MREGIVDRLKRERETYFKDRFGLESNPFILSPYGDIERLAKVFVDRKEEIERAVITCLEEPRNILVYGMFGIGKSAFILKVLYEFAKAINIHSLTSYSYLGEATSKGFVAQALLSLATSLTGNEKAEQYKKTLLGTSRVKEIEKEVSGEIEGGILVMKGKGGGKLAFTSAEIMETNLDQLKLQAMFKELVKISKHKADRIIIAIDETDKRSAAKVQEIIAECRGLLHEPVSFILTTSLRSMIYRADELGKKLDDIYSTFYGAFDEKIEIKPFSLTDLSIFEELVEKALDLVRISKFEKGIFPFTNNGIEFIAKRSHGIPRVFNRICRDVLDIAWRLKLKQINSAAVKYCFRVRGKEILESLPRKQRKLIDLINERGGTLERVDGELVTKYKAKNKQAVYRQLGFLVQNDKIIKIETEEGTTYEVIPEIKEVT